MQVQGVRHVQGPPPGQEVHAVGSNGRRLFVGMYANEAQRACAEAFMMRDPKLLAACERATDARLSPSSLRIYLTQNPCHYSSSNSESLADKAKRARDVR